MAEQDMRHLVSYELLPDFALGIVLARPEVHGIADGKRACLDLWRLVAVSEDADTRKILCFSWSYWAPTPKVEQDAARCDVGRTFRCGRR